MSPPTDHHRDRPADARYAADADAGRAPCESSRRARKAQLAATLAHEIGHLADAGVSGPVERAHEARRTDEFEVDEIEAIESTEPKRRERAPALCDRCDLGMIERPSVCPRQGSRIRCSRSVVSLWCMGFIPETG